MTRLTSIAAAIIAAVCNAASAETIRYEVGYESTSSTGETTEEIVYFVELESETTPFDLSNVTLDLGAGFAEFETLSVATENETLFFQNDDPFDSFDITVDWITSINGPFGFFAGFQFELDESGEISEFSWFDSSFDFDFSGNPAGCDLEIFSAGVSASDVPYAPCNGATFGRRVGDIAGQPDVSPVPLPATSLLLALGLLAIPAARRLT